VQVQKYNSGMIVALVLLMHVDNGHDRSTGGAQSLFELPLFTLDQFQFSQKNANNSFAKNTVAQQYM
jgi:hypothetical protein